MTTTSGGMGSGREVEWAAFHPASFESGSLRSRVRGRLESLRGSLSRATHSMRVSVDDSMKSKPMLWAGIAAGSGFAIGMAGRFVQWRHHRRQAGAPSLVILDATC